MKQPFFFDYRYAADKGNFRQVVPVNETDFIDELKEKGRNVVVPGDHIFYTKVSFPIPLVGKVEPPFVSHHAVYVGTQHDVPDDSSHTTKTTRAVVHILPRNKEGRHGFPELVSLDYFFKRAEEKGSPVYAIKYKENTRLGPKEAVEKCMQLVNNPGLKNEHEFQRWSNNCENLVQYCVLGDEQSASKQVEAFKRTGYAIGASALGAAGLALGAKALRAGAMQKSRKSYRSKRSKSKTKTTKRSKRTKTTKRSRKPRTKRSRRSRSRRS